MNMGEGRLVAQADSMPALLINVKIEGHAGLAQRCGEPE